MTAKFGTFSGVVLPSVLAILGAVMYYIAPQVLGGVGLFQMLLIILIAHSVTIATAFSISAIATNINVKGGGLYYLISRSLGSEFGGSLGIQLYLAQTIASSFYAIAFARGVNSILLRFGLTFPEQYIAFIALLVFGVMVYIGAHFVVRLQYIILGTIVASLVSIFLAPSVTGGGIETAAVVATPLSFWVAFSMFFPAVTGIDAGVGMSGNLRNPRRSLVSGTFFAIVATMVVYIALAFKMSTSASMTQLASDIYIIEKMSIFPALVLAGILMATSSSALSSLMTSPRCLQAMVFDKLLPRQLNFLGKGYGKTSEPRPAIVFSLLIGLFVISLGSLEFVSQIVSIFFLSVYGWINGAAFFEKISQNPSYRPTFNCPAYISFYGMFAAYAVMYLFNPKIMFFGIIIQLSIFFVFTRTKRSRKLESVWNGVFFQLLRMLIRWFDKTERTKKNWRPTILAFCANELNKTAIANFLHWIGSGRSITKQYFLVKGDLKNNAEEKERIEKSLLDYIDEYQLTDIFPKAILSDDFEGTIQSVMQTETVANIPLNTVLVDYDRNIKINKLIYDMTALKKNVIILRNQTGFSGFKKVDVWWNTEKNGNFMILLAYLLTHSRKWLEEGAVIRIFKITEVDIEKEQYHLEKILKDSRIENAEIHIIKGKQEKLKEIITSKSEHSDLVIMGIPHFSTRESDDDIIEHINEFTDKLKVSLICLANDKIDFRSH